MVCDRGGREGGKGSIRVEDRQDRQREGDIQRERARERDRESERERERGGQRGDIGREKDVLGTDRTGL